MKYPTPEVSLSSGERALIRQLAALRATLERLVRSQHERHGPVDQAVYAADVELHWTLLLEAHSRGINALRAGLHQGEGVDHEMVDAAIEYALTPTSKKGGQ